MFHRIGRVVVRHPVWTIVAWVVAAVAIVLTAPSLPSSSDQSSFLPKSYESIQAADVQAKAFPSAFTPAAIVLLQRTDGAAMGKADYAEAAQLAQAIEGKHIDQVQKVVPGMPSKDGKYDMVLIQMDSKTTGQPAQSDAVQKLRDDMPALVKGTGLDAKVGGQAASALDQQKASEKGMGLTGLGTVLVIVISMALIFRSFILTLLPIVTLFALVDTTANGLIADATKIFGLQSNSSVSSILLVVLLGVGTDYFLFLMFRYRERLRLGDEPKEAMINAVDRVGEAIASAAGTVIIAFLALLLSSVGFLKQMGPALAIAVAVTLLAGLTLFPAICSLIPPRALFWASKSWKVEPTGSRFASLGRMVGRRPAVIAAVSGVLMVALSLGATGFKATFDLSAGSVPATAESTIVQNEMTAAYSAGAAEPTTVLLVSTDGKPLDQAQLPAFGQKLATTDGVAVVAPPKLSADGTTADYNLELKYGASSDAALAAINGVRDTAHAAAPADTKALVGGLTAVYKDFNAAINHDYGTVFPVAAILIMIILGLLLRSVVAPWYLMASVALGFGATLGSTVLIFQNLKGDAGLMFMLPVIMYLFVVAIGTDYNILMIARLREEAQEGREPREAASMAVRHAGPTVAAAGFILAATFAMLALGGGSFLVPMSFALSFGIFLAAFVMAMFFTPALTALIGHAAWWPGHADRRRAESSRVVASSAGTRSQDDELDPSRR
ncbi:MMPL family transporter [Streptacidiphilus melanogenes]|uniref:MMPL family transporter n=1 Tax=Streptacidiphilus melanogenes TaxID=411235 RepID=UPI0005A92E16|nr:MMPL family transporter [Streptacidiphilus melanogenes]